MGYQPSEETSNMLGKFEYCWVFTDVARSLEPLKPTGKWRIRYCPYNERYLLDIQHKTGIFFSTWVEEDSIVYRDKPMLKVFDCKG
jgi:hypothetical protein